MAKLTNINDSVKNFFPIHTIDQFLPKLIQIALILGSIATFVWLLWGGVQLIGSGGNPETTKTAKNKITQAVFGLAFLALVWVIWRLIVYFLGISNTPQGQFRINIPTP